MNLHQAAQRSAVLPMPATTIAIAAHDPITSMMPATAYRSIGVNPVHRRIYSLNADSKKRQFLGCATKRELTPMVEASSSSWYCCARSGQAAVLSESTQNAGDPKRRHARASSRVASVLSVRGASVLSECPEYAGALAPSHSVRDRAGYERRVTAWPGRVCSRPVGPNPSPRGATSLAVRCPAILCLGQTPPLGSQSPGGAFW